MGEVFGVTGMPLSGKTTVAEFMEDQGFAVLDMGEVVRIEMDKRDIPAEETGDWVNDMRDKHGMDAIAQISIPYLEEILHEKEDVVIAGMRGWTEKQRFEKEIDERLEMISVWTSRETRKERKDERNRKEDVTGDEFHERDLRETGNGVGKLMALSDHMIKNQGIGKQRLEEKVKNIIES